MSVTYISIALIGIKLDSSKLWLKTTVRGCNHKEYIEHKYCHECGKPMFITKREIHPMFTSEDCENEWFDTGKIIGDKFQLVVNSMDIEKTDVFIGIRVSAYERGWGVKGYERIDIPNIGEVRAELEELLSPLGLWDSKLFGLYSIAYVSH